MRSLSTTAVEAVGWACVAIVAIVLTLPHTGGRVLVLAALYLSGAALLTTARLVSLLGADEVPRGAGGADRP